jgi:hypothetical protein
MQTALELLDRKTIWPVPRRLRGSALNSPCCSQEDVVMQIDTPTPTDYLPNNAIVDRVTETRPADEDAELTRLLLLRQMQEPIVWPRVFPGL